MTVTTKGFQGTVSDVDMATQFPMQVPTVASAADLAVTAVGGSRTVSVAAGSQRHAFVKYSSDAAQTLNLTPPASGGKWYLVAINRQWSPTNTAVLEAVDIAAATAGAVPTYVDATTMSAAVAAYRNSPGTTGTGQGAHAALALVHVRAADTTLTIFDMRARATGLLPTFPNFYAMILYASLAQIQEGALCSIGQHTLPSGGTHTRSVWQRVQGVFMPVGRILVNDSAATDPTSATNPKGTAIANNSRADIFGIANLAYSGINLAFEAGAALHDAASQTEFRFFWPFNVAVWKPWDSSWMAYTVTTTGHTVSNYTTGYTWRYVAGEVEVRFGGTINGGLDGQPFSMTVPVPMASLINGNGDDIMNWLRGYDGAGGNLYKLGCVYRDANRIWFDCEIIVTVNSKQVQRRNQVDSATPFTWSSSGQSNIEGRLKYTPA